MGNTCKEIMGGEDLQFEIQNIDESSKYSFKRAVRKYYLNIKKLVKSNQ